MPKACVFCTINLSSVLLDRPGFFGSRVNLTVALVSLGLFLVLVWQYQIAAVSIQKLLLAGMAAIVSLGLASLKDLLLPKP